MLERPILHQPILERPILDQPILERPILERPILDQPILERPILERPILHQPILPHHKLRAFGVAKELLLAVKAADVRDAHLRDQAMRAAQSACLNTAEGAARVTRADKARAFTIARGECVEAAAAIEIAALCGTAKQADSDRVAVIANALVAMLTRLIR